MSTSAEVVRTRRLETAIKTSTRSATPAFFSALPVACSGTALASESWTAPKTPWGDPDLSGIYTNTTLTPFERPADLGDKAFLTEEEVAELESGRAEQIEGLHARPASETQAGGSIGAYNLHWMELGMKVVGSRSTSLVVDPPNGRVPVRPEAEEERRYHLERIADSYEHMSGWDRCITRGVPGGMFPAGYNNGYQVHAERLICNFIGATVRAGYYD